MAETLSMLSTISFVVAGVALVGAIFLWVFFKIPRVIGDLSGRNARKSVARVRASNEKSGEKSYRPSTVNAARGKLTNTMPQTQSGQPTEEMQPAGGNMPETSLLAENRGAGKDSPDTELLREEETTGMLADENSTAPRAGTPAQIERRAAHGKQLHLIEEIILIHTDEVIE